MQKLMEKHRKAMANGAGFTLVELIVVIAILAVLAAVLVPQYIQYVERSRQKADYSTLSEIQHTVNIELATLETPPDDGAALVTFIVAPTGAITFGEVSETTGSLNANVEGVVGSGTLKSANAAGDYMLKYDEDTNSAVWDNTSQALIDELQTGTAS